MRNKTYFLSDIHLGASYIKDKRAHEARVVSFLQSIEADASAVYLLGDVLDYWYEYRTVVPRGYVRFFGQLARMADAGIKLVWFIGNHDIWLFDYLRNEIGIEIVNTNQGGVLRNIDGVDFFLGHGDTFGKQPGSYMALRRIFHNRFCQWMYASIHPRWTIAFAHAWSAHSRKGSYQPNISAEVYANVMDFARKLAVGNKKLRYIIIGHHHVPLEADVTDKVRLIILGNWIDESSYAVFDGKSLSLCEYKQ